jgi:hypothetical protein
MMRELGQTSARLAFDTGLSVSFDDAHGVSPVTARSEPHDLFALEASSHIGHCSKDGRTDPDRGNG